MSLGLGPLLAAVISISAAPEPAEPAAATDDEKPDLIGTDEPVKVAPSEDEAPADDKPKDTRPWIKRFRPQRNLFELGVFGGLFIANPDHDLYDPRTAPQEPLWRIAPDIGLRFAYFPLRPLGIETEFSAVPHRVRSITNDFAFVYGFRGHVIVQLPYYNVVPFVLGGYGLLGVRSNILILGNDIDPAFHYGGGVKVFFSKWLGARLEARNIISSAEAREDSGASHVQVLAGLVITFNRKPPPPPPKPPPPVDNDRDKDGIQNRFDDCPDTPGVEPHGCPDSDGDTFIDSKDACPEVPGVAPDGCPVKDTDGDGIIDKEDDCVFRPEDFNGFEDDDGCPDVVPEVFDGVIEGIEFDFKKAEIRPKSRPLLDDAIAELKKFPEVRINIVGHTDDKGTEEFNLALSKQRAEAVKAYLIAGGVEESRITTEGKGMSAPRDTNDTEAGRARNRRIEFEPIVDKNGADRRKKAAAKAGAAKKKAADADAAENE